MVDRLRALFHGTGPGSWILWFVLLGVVFWLLLPELSSGAVGALTGLFAALRLELNALRERVERLEREAVEA